MMFRLGSLCWFAVSVVRLSRGLKRMSTASWLTLIGLCSVAQAHLTRLTVDSSLMLQLRPRLPKVLQELTSCPLCSGFWFAQMLSFWAFGTHIYSIIVGLAVAFVGDALYQAKLKLLPCANCSAK